LAAAVAGTGLADGALHHSVPPDVLGRFAPTAETAATRPWLLLSAIVLTRDPKMLAVACAGVVVLVGWAEHRVGWARALAAGIGGSLVATLVCDAVLLVGAGAGFAAARQAAASADYGVSAVVAGAAGALACTLPPWPAVALTVAMLNGLVVHHSLPDWEHVVAFAVGMVVMGPR
jgi:hypothetical protein